MWRCNNCGSTEISCHVVGSFAAEWKVDRFGKVDKSSIDLENIDIYNDDLEENLFICKNCRANADTIEEIADWEDE